MTEQPPAGTTDQDQEVLMTHVFDAPRDLVFEAWTDPDQVARWWGPVGFNVPRETVEIDLRVGGGFNLVMVQADTGAEHPLRYEIVELVVPELLVMKSEPMPEMGLTDPTTTRLELHDQGDKTQMRLTDGPYTAMMLGGVEAGWKGSFEKLARLLARDI